MDLDRPGRLWRVREGDYYVFHLEPPLDEDAELAACLAQADARYSRVLQALGQGDPPAKDSARLVKVNYWLHAVPLPPAEVHELPAPATDVTVATGRVTQAGIHFALRGMRWTDLADKLLHEEVHAAWHREVRDAPPLLNEGVAVWFELQLSQRDRLAELGAAWKAVVASGECRLRDLTRTPDFWASDRRELPVYEVGGSLVGYLIEAHGLPVLKAICQRSFWEDEHLAELIERETDTPLETTEARIGEWLPRRIARAAGPSAPAK